MTASEIAETLINGNISDARREILYLNGDAPANVAVLTLDVLWELAYQLPLTSYSEAVDMIGAHMRLRRCLAGA